MVAALGQARIACDDVVEYRAQLLGVVEIDDSGNHVAVAGRGVRGHLVVTAAGERAGDDDNDDEQQRGADAAEDPLISLAALGGRVWMGHKSPSGCECGRSVIAATARSVSVRLEIPGRLE